MTLLELIDNKNYTVVKDKFCIIPKDHKYIVLKDVNLSIEKKQGTFFTYYIHDKNSNEDFWISHFEISKSFVGSDLKKLIKDFDNEVNQISLLDYIYSLSYQVKEMFRSLKVFKEKYNLQTFSSNIISVQLNGKKDIKVGDHIYIISEGNVKKTEILFCNSYYISYVDRWTSSCTRDSLEFGLTEKEAIENYHLHLTCQYNDVKSQLNIFQNLYNNYIPSIQNIKDFERELDKSNRSVQDHV